MIIYKIKEHKQHTSNVSSPQELKMHVKNISRIVGHQLSKFILGELEQNSTIYTPGATVYIQITKPKLADSPGKPLPYMSHWPLKWICENKDRWVICITACMEYNPLIIINTCLYIQLQYI